MSQFSIEYFFHLFSEKKVWIPLNWKNVSMYDEFEPIWDELIIFGKKNLKFFFSYFQKKDLNCSELKESVHYDEFLPLGYQRRKVKFVWSPKGKNLKFFFSTKKGLNCSELKESVHFDEFEHIWDELIIFEKKSEKIWKKIF